MTLTQRSAQEIADLLQEIVQVILRTKARTGALNIDTGAFQKGLVWFHHVLRDTYINLKLDEAGIALPIGRLDPAEYPWLDQLSAAQTASLQRAQNVLIFFVEMIYQELAVRGRTEVDDVASGAFELLKFLEGLGKLQERLFIMTGRSLGALPLRTVEEAVDDAVLEELAGIDEGVAVVIRGTRTENGKRVSILKEHLLTMRFIVRFLNDPSFLSEVATLEMQKSAGLFRAAKANPFGSFDTSIADVVLAMMDGRVIRFELKAWWATRLEVLVDTGRLKLSHDPTRSAARQAYRYLFESVFLYDDMSSLRYVIPEPPKDAPGEGITSDQVKTMLRQIFAMDGAAVRELFDTPPSLSDEVVEGLDALTARRMELAKEAYRAAMAEDPPDVSLGNVIQHWNAKIRANPTEWTGIPELADADVATRFEDHLSDTVGGEAKAMIDRAVIEAAPF